MRLASAVLLVFFCLLASVPIHSQSTSTGPQSPPSVEPKKPVFEPATVLKVTTRLVVVDVVATDNTGRGIDDLKPQDFTVMEDGRQQQLRIFSFRRPQPAGKVTLPAKPLNFPANVYTNVPPYRLQNSLNIILLDRLNTGFTDQAYARQQILKYLASIPDGQPIAIAVYALSRKLRLVQDFTSDFAALRNAVNDVKSEHPPILENPSSDIPSDTKELVPHLPATRQSRNLQESMSPCCKWTAALSTP